MSRPRNVKIGDLIKVYLPGESPWAECVSIHADGTWSGRIDNNLVSNHHSFKIHQVVKFRRQDIEGDRYVWSPVEEETATHH